MKKLLLKMLEERLLRGNTVVGVLLIGVAIYDHINGSDLLTPIGAIASAYLVYQKG